MGDSLDISNEQPQKKGGEIEINLLELIRKLWSERKYIVKITTIFAAIGLLIAIFSPNEYVSSVTMVPQLGDNTKNKAGGLAAMAAMAGFSMGDFGTGDVLSPTIYPQILESAAFKKELIYTKVKFENIPQEISLFEYYTNSDFQPFNLGKIIKKYTIGLPALIVKAIKGDDNNSSSSSSKSLPYIKFTPKESKVAAILSNNVNLTVNEKEGILVLTANMPEAMASTQVVEAARLLLQKYIINLKIDKVKKNLEFVEGRYNDAKRDYISKQRQLASFRDANRNVVLASAGITQERLANDLSIAYNVYAELAKQMEQAKIKVKDETPVVSVIKPAFIPNEKSKPNRPLIMIFFIFLGFITPSGIIIFKEIKSSIFS